MVKKSVVPLVWGNPGERIKIKEFRGNLKSDFYFSEGKGENLDFLISYTDDTNLFLKGIDGTTRTISKNDARLIMVELLSPPKLASCKKCGGDPSACH